MSKKTQLRIVGLSAAEIRGEAYVLILADADGGPRRIPIVLGRPEAQAIAMVLEQVSTERPTTHDLFVSFSHAFGVHLTEMLITRFEDGVYFSELTFADEDGERTVTMDSRTSDAIAIAMRTDTPIYASEQVMETAGFVLPEPEDFESDDEDECDDDSDCGEADDDDSDDFGADICAEPMEPERKSPRHANPENYTIEELERTLERLIKNENYEEAAGINDILQRKRRER